MLRCYRVFSSLLRRGASPLSDAHVAVTWNSHTRNFKRDNMADEEGLARPLPTDLK